MDPVTLSLAKTYTDRKGGYETSSTLTFDGNTEGKDTINYQGIQFYKVSDRVLTTDELRSSTFVVANEDGSVTILTAEQGAIFDSSALGIPAGLFTGFLADHYGVLAVSGKPFDVDGVSNPSDGTYFVKHPLGGFHLHKLSFKTIVPIDPKYLPGVCLPVVELSTVFILSDREMTPEDSAKLDALNGEPFIAVLGIAQEYEAVEATTRLKLVMNAVTTGEALMYGAAIVNTQIYIRSIDGIWYCGYDA